MRLLTKETDYAIRALIAIAETRSQCLTAAEIAEQEGIPWLFLRRLLQRLAGSGILSSQKGRTGGFCMARPARQVTLAGVIRVFQGEIELSECLVQGKPCCNRPTCVVRKRLKAIEAGLRQDLDRISIAMLVRMKRRELGTTRK
jgi:Rrf2 family protein